MYNPQKVAEGLNNLLEKNYDAQKGFERASEATDNTRLKLFFKNKYNQRRACGNQLVGEIIRIGGAPIKDGSIDGFMHRAWIGVKTVFSSSNEEAMLAACEIGERASLREYDEFLNTVEMGENTRRLVENQRNHIALTIGKVKELEIAQNS